MFPPAIVSGGSSSGGAAGGQNPASVVASTYGVSTGASGSANFTALQNAINATPAGGTLLLDWTGTITVDLSTSLSIPADIVVVGRGRGTKFKFGPESTTSNLTGFLVSTAGVIAEIRDCLIEGPTALGAGGTFTAFQHIGTSGLIVAQNVYFKYYTFGFRRAPSANSTVSGEARKCVFEGYGGVASTGCMFGSSGTGQVGAYLTVDGCRFINNGQTATNQHHGIYCYPDIDLDVTNCKFSNRVGTGFDIQIFNSGTTAAARSVGVTDNTFICANGTAVLTSANSPTVVEGNRFFISGTGRWIQFQGSCDAIGNTIDVSAATGDYLAKDDGATAGYTILIEGNVFRGSGSYYDQFYWGVPGDVTYTGNVTSGAGPTNALFEVTLSAGTTKHTFDGNRFTYSSGGVVVANANTNLTVLNVRDNDFSQAAANPLTLTGAPGTVTRRNNYGSNVGNARGENNGSYSAQPGAVTSFTVAHGLPATPTNVLAMAKDANAAGKAPWLTVDATNITFNFSAALTAATTYSWWWRAEL